MSSALLAGKPPTIGDALPQQNVKMRKKRPTNVLLLKLSSQMTLNRVFVRLVNIYQGRIIKITYFDKSGFASSTIANWSDIAVSQHFSSRKTGDENMEAMDTTMTFDRAIAKWGSASLQKILWDKVPNEGEHTYQGQAWMLEFLQLELVGPFSVLDSRKRWGWRGLRWESKQRQNLPPTRLSDVRLQIFHFGKSLLIRSSPWPDWLLLSNGEFFPRIEMCSQTI